MSRKELLEALLDQPQYRSLYVNSAGFHTAVDSILSMLPTWLAGLAAQSLSDEARRVEALQKIMDEPVNLSLDEMRFMPEADVAAVEQAVTELVAAELVAELEPEPTEIASVDEMRFVPEVDVAPPRRKAAKKRVAAPVKRKPVTKKATRRR